MALSARIETAKNEFAKKHSLPSNEPSTLEAFFTHNVLLHRNVTDFLAEQSWRGEKKILVGGTQDTQLDAIVVCIDGEVVRPDDDLSDFEDAAAEGEAPKVSFIFIQATGKEAGGTKLTQKISAFSDGVFAFFFNDGSSSKGVRPAILEWVKLKNRIFEILGDNDLEECCECAMYFVWPKQFKSDDNVEFAITTAKEKVKTFDKRFYDVGFYAFDRAKIEGIIEEAEKSRTFPEDGMSNIEVSLEHFVAIPSQGKVAACYIGFLSAAELIELTSTKLGPDRELRAGIFSTNLRGYLGAGARVNASIGETLRSQTERNEFALRNNGLAIVAKDGAVVGRRTLLGTKPDKIRLISAQIVNGCQTSNTIFQNRKVLEGPAGANVYIPTKIIITNDKNVADAAILALNRQTPIDETRLFTGKNFVDELAWRFSDSSTAQANKILFERRAGEFKERPVAEQPRILTLYELARAYASAFLANPAQVNARGKEKIINDIRNGIIFGKDQNTDAYCLCGLMVLRAREALLRIPSSRKWAKYPAKNLLLFAVRVIAENAAGSGEMPKKIDAPEGKDYLKKLGTVLTEPILAGKIADEAVRAVADAFGGQSAKITAKMAARADKVEAVRTRAAKVRVNSGR